ncbi:hypothetical protein Q8F57_033160 [Paraburkholderia terrae]|uniref:hypothetical protein n=1 Tax=Paraburkholderia terrae TaxID=311230 RepID=UPI00296AAA12|nr:hypothetical protein [Paraburkholderia terrae]MDW3657804.1 hypothetical protein [Paraburkholderia terrae]
MKNVELANHVWTESTLTLACIKRRIGVELPVSKTLDLSSTGYRPGGLLEEMLADSECPVDDIRADHLFRLLRRATSNPEVLRIFNTAPGLLFQRDLSKLISALDDVIDGYNVLHKSHPIRNVKHFLIQCRNRLADGELIKNVKLTSRHKDTKPNKAPAHYVYINDVFDDNFLATEVGSIDFETLAERDEKAKALLQQSLADARSVCKKIIERHEQLVEKLESLSATPLPSTIPARSRNAVKRGGTAKTEVCKRLCPDNLLHLHTHTIDGACAITGKRVSLYGIRRLADFWSLPNCQEGEYFSMLLSRHYLPRSVVTACAILLLIEIGWNWPTLLTVNLSNIIEDEFGYTLQGVKHKTGQIQKANLNELPDAEFDDDFDEESAVEGQATKAPNPAKIISDALSVKALSLLIQHRKNIDENFDIQSQSIFVSMRFRDRNSTTFVFGVGRQSEYLKLFCALTGLDEFTFNDLRHRAAHTRYLATGRDIVQTQLFLGHAAADVTTVYLNSTIVRLLGEANLLKYVMLLGDCVYYATGRKEKLDAKRLARVEKNNLLLFPPSTLEDQGVDCVADRWVESFGTTPFLIGEPEIAHIALQYRLYTRNLTALVQANHERFVAKHLPRIVFCCALYQVVANGPLSHVLKRIEAEYA